MIDIARERVPGAELVVGDLEEALPFEPESFDVVTAFNSVQYAADPVTAQANGPRAKPAGSSRYPLAWGPPERRESGVIFAEMGTADAARTARRAWRHRVER